MFKGNGKKMDVQENRLMRSKTNIFFEILKMYKVSAPIQRPLLKKDKLTQYGYHNVKKLVLELEEKL